MSISDLETRHFFTLKGYEPFFDLFSKSRYPWELLPEIAPFIAALGPQLSKDKYDLLKEGVWVAKSARIADYATILGPAIIGEEVELRPGAFIRSHVYVGPHSVVGNSSELKNVILIGWAEVPHFNYVGDSILSYGAHLGAGAITSNLRADRQAVKVRFEGQCLETGLRKFGAMIAEKVEVGCNAVLNPGVTLGQASRVYPLSSVRDSVPAGHIFKNDGSVSPLRDRN